MARRAEKVTPFLAGRYVNRDGHWWRVQESEHVTVATAISGNPQNIARRSDPKERDDLPGHGAHLWEARPVRSLRDHAKDRRGKLTVVADVAVLADHLADALGGMSVAAASLTHFETGIVVAGTSCGRTGGGWGRLVLSYVGWDFQCIATVRLPEWTAAVARATYAKHPYVRRG
jgi:hypothetical protein